MNNMRELNKFMDQNQDLISKALTTASGVGGALIPENLEKIITDTVIRLSPELALLEANAEKISGKTHEFNRKTKNPTRGGAMGESATTGTSNSKTTRHTVELKIVRRKGKVTNFLNDTSEEYIDAAAYEIENHIQSHVSDLIYYMLYGNALGNTWEFTGLDNMILTNRNNQAEGGAVPTSLSVLDSMISKSNRKGGAKHRRVFGMTPEMLDKFSSLLTNVRLNQGVGGDGLTQVEVGGGWRLNAYRDIPIIETTACGPIEKLTSTLTVTDVDGITGGALSDGTYYIRVAPMTYEGEQEASDEETVVVNGGTATQSIRINLDAVHTTDGEDSPLAYKIYASDTSGDTKLVRYYSAFTYDSEGAVTGDNGTGTDYLYVHSMTAGSEIATGLQNDRPLVATGGVRPEVIYLWDLDPIQGLGKLPYTNRGGSAFGGLVTTKDLAETDDFISFLIKSYTALTPSFEKTSVWERGYRTA